MFPFAYCTSKSLFATLFFTQSHADHNEMTHILKRRGGGVTVQRQAAVWARLQGNADVPFKINLDSTALMIRANSGAFFSLQVKQWPRAKMAVYSKMFRMQLFDDAGKMLFPSVWIAEG